LRFGPLFLDFSGATLAFAPSKFFFLQRKFKKTYEKINKKRHADLLFLAQKPQLLACYEIVEDLISGATFG